MIFAPDLAAKITLGEKTVTRRKRERGKPCRYVAGRSYAMQLARGGMALERLTILRVSPELLGSIDRGDAIREGFPTVEAFQQRWIDLYGKWEPELPVWRIEFELDADWPRDQAGAEDPATPQKGVGQSDVSP